MTHFRDGEPFTFPYGGRPDPHVRAIGWLVSSERFTKGPAPDGFLEQLIWLCCWPSNLTRGLHRCPFCPREEAALRVGGSWVRAPFGDYVTGHGEAHIAGPDGVRFASPDMIAHYVQIHEYLPPADFVQAVLRTPAGRIPISASSGTWLALEHDRWIVGGGATEPNDIGDPLTALLPLLERDPTTVLRLDGKAIREAEPDSRLVVQCNLLGTKGQPPRAYVAHPNLGNVAQRIEVLVRHKQGALAALWVPIDHVDRFRLKTLPVEHPRFHDRRIVDYPTRQDAQRIADWLQASADSALARPRYRHVHDRNPQDEQAPGVHQGSALEAVR
jgi:hypothetical protein